MARTVASIYKIENTKTSVIYVGGTSNFKKRKACHLSKLKNGTHENRKLQYDFCLYGSECFVFNVLEHTSNEILKEREQFYIDTLFPFYNICKNSESSLGVKRTIEFCEKQKKNKNAKGRVATSDQRIRMSEIKKAKITDIERKRLSNIAKGNTNRRGKVMPTSAIISISGENNVNHKLSDIQVLEIRAKYIPRVYSSYTLAKEYGVCRQQINRIVKGIDRKSV